MRRGMVAFARLQGPRGQRRRCRHRMVEAVPWTRPAMPASAL